MFNRAINKTAILAAGFFIAVAPAVYAQEPNPDTMKQDQADLAKERGIRTQDDRTLRGLSDQIHKLEAERGGVSAQVAVDEKAWTTAQAKYSADQKGHASKDQLAKDQQAIEQARAAKERDIQRRLEFDQKIAQLKAQFAASNSQRNKDTAELKTEEMETRRDRGNDRTDQNQDNRNRTELNMEIRKLEAERNALNSEVNKDKNAANEAEAKYAADQKNHASSAQLEQDRLALQRVEAIRRKDMQHEQELDQRIAQLKAQYAAEAK